MKRRDVDVNDAAERFAVALAGTTERYFGNLMSHGTWDSHMADLWSQAEARGLTARVTELLNPLNPAPMLVKKFPTIYSAVSDPAKSLYRRSPKKSER